MTDHTDTHSLYVLVISLLGIYQPSWNPDQLTGSLVFHRSRLCCSWSRCLATFLKRYLTPKTLLHPRIIISVTQSLLPPSLRHRWAHSLNVTA
jgi:hypothetical protein